MKGEKDTKQQKLQKQEKHCHYDSYDEQVARAEGEGMTNN